MIRWRREADDPSDVVTVGLRDVAEVGGGIAGVLVGGWAGIVGAIALPGPTIVGSIALGAIFGGLLGAYAGSWAGRDASWTACPPRKDAADTMAAMARDRDRLLGTLAAIAAASLFGMLGPLARFGAEAGVGGRRVHGLAGASSGVAFLAVLILVRGRGAGSVGGAPRPSRDAAGSPSLIAAVMGITLNVSIFTAFGLVPIALALMLFYTYPAGVAVVDVALGRERATTPRVAALALSFTGVVLVLLGGMDAGAAASISLLGVALAPRGRREPGRVRDGQPVRVLERPGRRGDARDPRPRPSSGASVDRRDRGPGVGRSRRRSPRSTRGRRCCSRASPPRASRRCCS